MRGWLERAGRSAASANVLMAAGDCEGASNRAYYAMFYAALAVLSEKYDYDVVRLKTHASIHSLFGRAAILSGDMDPEFGRLMNGAELLRLRSDYDTVDLDSADVSRMVEAAHRFVETVERLLGRPENPTP